MKSSELRIGNYLLKDGVVVTIDGRSIFDIWCAEQSPTANHPYHAVPITEEWLLRLGFVYRNENRGEGAILDLKNDDWKKSLTIAFAYYNRGIAVLSAGRNNVFFIHELQNLYFVLTGQELTSQQ